MPIYEYQCKACGERIEKFQKISDDPVRHCPNCETDTMEKLVSAAAFKLTGSGWYETDFKDKKPNTEKKQSDKKESAKKDSKAAEKSEKPKTKSANSASSNKASTAK